MKFVSFLFCLFVMRPFAAQQMEPPILERLVSMNAERLSLGEVMNLLEEQVGFSFSYNPTVIDETSTVSVHVQKRPLREVLTKLFGEKIGFREKSGYVILSKRKEVEKKIVVGGYVQNERGEPVPDATVYDESSLVSANTNRYGYYEMKIPKRIEPIRFNVRKYDFIDTLVPVAPDSFLLRNVVIKQQPRDSTWQRIKEETNLALKETGEFASRTWDSLSAFLFPPKPEVLNVTDTIHRNFQFSVLPFAGTNRAMSGRVVNNWSLNLFGGYNMGVRKAEVSGFFNANRSNVRYMQAAGFGNMVGGNFDGAQLAGFFNFNSNETRGAQFAGFGNANGGNASGFIASGFANVNMKETDGLLVAGFSNFNFGKSKGLQLAGFSNINLGDADGVQIAGFANVARKVKGSQISVFNLCDSISGVPFGIFSYVHHGYHKLEISADEIFPVNIQLRSGVHKFYNTINTGFVPRTLNDSVSWTFGYGIGTAPRLARWLYLNIDLNTNQVIKANIGNELNLLNKLTVGFDVQLARKFSVAFGATLYGYLTETGSTPLAHSVLNPDILHTEYFGNQFKLEHWIGWKVGVRFF